MLEVNDAFGKLVVLEVFVGEDSVAQAGVPAHPNELASQDYVTLLSEIH